MRIANRELQKNDLRVSSRSAIRNPHGWIRSSLLIPLLIASVTTAAFLPSLSNGFVNWDDPPTILDNPYIRPLGPQQLRWMFTTFHMGPYQPLSWLSLALDYRIWGLNPRGFHLTSLLLHAVNAVAFYFVSRRLLEAAATAHVRPGQGNASARELTCGDIRDRLLPSWWGLDAGAALAALIFAIHPLRVESVVWATERRDVLSGCFVLSAVWAYLKAAERPPRREYGSIWLAVALGLFTAALLAKAVTLVLPAVLMVLDVYPLRRASGSLYELLLGHTSIGRLGSVVAGVDPDRSHYSHDWESPQHKTVGSLRSHHRHPSLEDGRATRPSHIHSTTPAAEFLSRFGSR